jgi:hypothetical protein
LALHFISPGHIALRVLVARKRPQMPKTDHRVTLTPTKITGLKPAKKGQRYQVMDTMVPGFGIRVTERGSRTFILRTRYPGSDSPSRREIGKCDDITLSDAREKARQWREMVRKGIDPADEEERQRYAEILKRQTTFAAVAEDFIRDKLPGERRGKDAEREIRRDLLPKLGKAGDQRDHRQACVVSNQGEGSGWQGWGAESPCADKAVL